ncbi:antitoxin [Saccharothrix australiensis]|uniref:Antitoxin protein of toxin-antitoxin system n=1 Tax=Saccharothrix australiensis TaxID=2072 RepID=A0A495VRV6_9PSEU|nr:antitoxin [Saccharothrix australiensis]RKT52042.1 antitoxin protein of toxin-antitoxin system [Saccharothrix australiensis]
MNFDELKNKAFEVLEENHEKVDQGIDAAAEFIAGRFGHEEQVRTVAEQAKNILPGGE